MYSEPLGGMGISSFVILLCALGVLMPFTPDNMAEKTMLKAQEEGNGRED